MKILLSLLFLLAITAPQSLSQEEGAPEEPAAPPAPVEAPPAPPVQETPDDELPPVTGEEVSEMLSLYLGATRRKEREGALQRILDLEARGLTPELLFEVMEHHDCYTVDRTPFVERGKQGIPEIEWPERRVRVIELGDLAPDVYSLHVPRDYVETGEKLYPAVIDLGEGVASTLVSGYDNNGVVIAFIHPDAIPPAGLTGSRQGQSLVFSVLRDLQRRAYVDPDRVFLTGGGRQGNAVFYFAAHHPHVFSGVMPFAGMLPEFRMYEKNTFHLAWRFVSRQPGPGTMKSYDFNMVNYERLKEEGALVSFRLLDRGMEEGRIQRFSREMHEFVRDTDRLTWPTKLKYRMNDSDHPEHYWVSVDKVLKPGRPKVIKIKGQFGDITDTRTVNSKIAEVTAACIMAGTRIEIATDNVKHMSVFLSPEFVDWGSEVEILVNGETRYKEIPRASLRLMLIRYRATLDPSSLPWCRVQILNV